MKQIVLIIVFGIILYLAGAFMAWQLNPKHWDGIGRFVFVLLFAWVSAMTFVFKEEIEDL